MRPALLLLRRPVCSQCTSSIGMLAFRRQASNSKIGPFRKGLLHDTQGLPETPARTRFAPSPTGYLHLGSLRTALYNYLLAKATDGQFVLRIEDTDQSRLVPDAEERLYRDLKWAGLSWDEGPDIGGKYGPYKQSERNVHYHKHVETLLKEGKAYRCFCSPAELEQHQTAAHMNGTPTNYPGTCRDIPLEVSESRKHEPHAVRFKSGKTPVEFWDVVYNRYKKGDTEEDFIIMKRDRMPTYHFANVVDDHMMDITHVIRGAEWLISTPKHIELYQALGWTPPKFAHLGLLVNQDGQKLSKRHGGVDIEEYKRGNVLPVALLNFVALHGWRRRGLKSEVLTLEDMVRLFDLRCGKGDITVSFEKLPYLDTKHRRGLVDRDPPDMERLLDLYLEPLRIAIVKLDVAMKTQNSLVSRPLHQVDKLQGNGDLVADLQRGNESQQNMFILKALRICSKLPEPKTSIQHWIYDYQHLFWNLKLGPMTEKRKQMPFDKIYIGEKETVVSKAMEQISATASAINSRSWNTETIQAQLQGLIKSITYQDRNTNEMVRAGGSIVLRWALVGGDHGPALFPIMDLLGRDETLQRLACAQEAAWDHEHASAPGKAPEMVQA